MKLFPTILLGLGVLAALTVGCDTMVSTQPYYYINMANRTHQDLDDVGVYYGNRMAAEKGVLSKGNLATYGPVALPIPGEAVVTWSRDIGHHRYPPEHSLAVKLTGIVPANPRDMNVWFLIEEDGSVTVKCAHKDDHAVNDPLHRSLNAYRQGPGTIEDLLYGATPVPGTTGQYEKVGGVVQADSNFRSLVGNLPVTKHPDGSQSATLPDGTAITVHARKPNGGFDIDPKAIGIIRAKLPTGKKIEIRYKGQ